MVGNAPGHDPGHGGIRQRRSPLNRQKLAIDQTSVDALHRALAAHPDGVAAYRVRAQLTAEAQVRLGLRGSAKIAGPWVSLGYFVFRRPLSAARQWLGV